MPLDLSKRRQGIVEPDYRVPVLFEELRQAQRDQRLIIDHDDAERGSDRTRRATGVTERLARSDA